MLVTFETSQLDRSPLKVLPANMPSMLVTLDPSQVDKSPWKSLFAKHRGHVRDARTSQPDRSPVSWQAMKALLRLLRCERSGEHRRQ